LLFPQRIVKANAFAMVGMAAYFTGVVRFPLPLIVLMIEITGIYTLIPSLFAACFSALLLASGLNDLPIYEALPERDLQKPKAGHHHGKAMPALNRSVS
jgi:CIC family chloride channel protein